MSGVDVILGGSERSLRGRALSLPTAELTKEMAKQQERNSKHLAVSAKLTKH
jgi:hypothetical protein